jgi:cyclopropane-fatty-acyl-phospholipid synthase
MGSRRAVALAAGRRHAHPNVAGRAARALEAVAAGRLRELPVTLSFWDGSRLPAAGAADGAPEVLIRDPVALAHILHRPSELGLARAWVSGVLDVDGDLEVVLRLRDRMRGIALSTAERARLGLAALNVVGARAVLRPPVPAIEARVRGPLHSPARDRAAVRHHYDVSNRFYELLLGPSMVYSCAYFADPDESLEDAQARKLELICHKLRLEPDDRLLDIGCGWGSLLLHAAAHHGVRGVGVTLSAAQAAYANERIARAGLADRVEVRAGDYRELRAERFDKIASVGMYEHVGRSEIDHYVARVRELLRPGGLFLNHGIACLRAARSRRDTFIARYVFPDGELHPVTDVMASMHAAGLEVRDVESLREHYPLTLRRWSANLAANRPEAIAAVGDARERVWRLYLVGVAQAFEAGEISVYQVLAARDGAAHGLPMTRGA